jgi:hypothetical protein
VSPICAEEKVNQITTNNPLTDADFFVGRTETQVCILRIPRQQLQKPFHWMMTSDQTQKQSGVTSAHPHAGHGPDRVHHVNSTVGIHPCAAIVAEQFVWLFADPFPDPSFQSCSGIW